MDNTSLLPEYFESVLEDEVYTSHLPEYFESVLEDEVWIKIKIDQIARQFVACGLNHESHILIDYFRDCVLATTLARDE